MAGIPNISKFTSSSFYKGIAKNTNKAMDAIGEKLDKSSVAQKVIKTFEPNGADNTFFGLGTIMLGFVLAPRILAALKRNPENKQSTEDEIKEILFRDVQTILIMLFGLKSLNSIIANASTKITGLPMVEKALSPIFDKNTKGFVNKASEFIQHPIQKTRIIGKNILDILNPIGGSASLNGEQIASKYTNYNSISEIQKFLADIPDHGGDSEKVFNKIKKAIITQQSKVIEAAGQTPNGNTGKLTQCAEENIKNAQDALNFFKNLDYETFAKKGIDETGYKKIIVDFFKNKENALAYSAEKTNSYLKTLALAIEVLYLGFGLPALNQKRLEKKYLSEKPIGEQRGDSFNPINDKHIKAQEIKLYSAFIK